MFRSKFSVATLAIGVLFTGQTLANESAPKTRAEVQAELAEAVRTGNTIIGESGVRLNEAFPNLYPQAQTSSSATRADVQMELAEAIRTGNIVIDESGQRLNEVSPQYAINDSVAESKTRAEVRAETAQAAANGYLYRHIEA